MIREKELNGILTVRQVATKLVVCEETVARWLRSRKLKGYKFGRLWRIKEDDLQSFIGDNGDGTRGAK